MECGRLGPHFGEAVSAHKPKFRVGDKIVHTDPPDPKWCGTFTVEICHDFNNEHFYAIRREDDIRPITPHIKFVDKRFKLDLDGLERILEKL